MGRSLDLTERALLDLSRIHDFTMEREMQRSEGDLALSDKIVDTIMAHLPRVSRAPFTYRKAKGHDDAAIREQVIEFGGSGFVVLFKVFDDRVTILAVRHQRELGFGG